MGTLKQMPPLTYRAKLFEVRCDTGAFKVAGTLDGFIDLAAPQGKTYQLSIAEAKLLAEVMANAVADVEANCLYGRDALLDGG